MNFPVFRKRLAVNKQPWSNSVDFILLERVGERIAYSTEILMFTPDDNTYGEVVRPTFSLYPNECQELMDNLWKLGFRPSEGTGSAGALAATQKHLEDMRKLVFEKDS